ncbi:MAG: hypothetical protein PCFJNLEI_00178 [Verrucomicrobiae bacterium]|nr:hypothetical protein [Verrucomicrobiae bacterium]
MTRWLLLLVVAGLTACSSTRNPDDISTIPWNRPQGWEGTGALGGFRPPGGQ